LKHDLEFMERINRDLAARRVACRMLNVPDHAGAEQLKRAYRDAAIRHHPDHNGNTAAANRRFVLIQCAYNLLAFDGPGDALLAEMDCQAAVPGDDTYQLDNQWGHFCWWRERFFGAETKDEANQVVSFQQREKEKP